MITPDRSSYPPVRGLERGLHVLQALNRSSNASTAELARATGLPRPTVHRLLETLNTLGFVARAGLRDRYRLTSQVHTLSAGHLQNDWMSELAEPELQALHATFTWPVSMATYEDGAMSLRVSTHHGNPLSLVKAVPGTRLSVLHSAMGRAWLAWCSERERVLILQMLEADDSRCTEAGRILTRRMLDETRARGYAMRQLGEGKRTSSIAVPVLGKHQVLACINVEWIDSALPMADAVAGFAVPLRQAAVRIATLYARHSA